MIDALKVYVFNVQQGDHILVHLPNGKIGIIDCKHLEFEGQQKGTSVKAVPCQFYLEHLAKEQKPVISFLILTHNDTDHISGINSLINYIIRNEIVVENVYYTGRIEYSLLSLLESLIQNLGIDLNKSSRKKLTGYKKNLNQFFNIRIKELKQINESLERAGLHVNQYISKEKENELKIACLAPKGDHVETFNERLIDKTQDMLLPLLFRNEINKKENETDDKEFEVIVDGTKINYNADRNQISITVSIKYKEHTLLFTGDTPPKILLESLPNVIEKDMVPSNFVKASHHGSKHSSSQEVWKNIINENKKLFVAVSAGKRYKHPHKEFVQHIKAVKDDFSIQRTNFCLGCLGELDEHSDKDFDWFDQEISSLSEGASIELSNPIEPKVNADHKVGLAAWIYEFNEGSPDPKVSFGTSKYIDPFEQCPSEHENCASNDV